jgi:hypothetical protein
VQFRSSVWHRLLKIFNQASVSFFFCHAEVMPQQLQAQSIPCYDSRDRA